MQVSSPERVLPGLADYLTSPKAAMAEGKVLSSSHDISISLLWSWCLFGGRSLGACASERSDVTCTCRLQPSSGPEGPCRAAVAPPAWSLLCVWPLWESWTRALRRVKQALRSCSCWLR